MKQIELFLITIILAVSPIFSQTATYSDTRITFTAKRDNNYDIYVMNADGSDLKRLTHDPVVEWAPSWSPDGKEIIFQRVISGENDSEIYIMNADGSDKRRITNNSEYDGQPDWSPYLNMED